MCYSLISCEISVCLLCTLLLHCVLSVCYLKWIFLETVCVCLFVHGLFQTVVLYVHHSVFRLLCLCLSVLLFPLFVTMCNVFSYRVAAFEVLVLVTSAPKYLYL
jgi:hypothetical protein